jgi:hypothetical protein
MPATQPVNGGICQYFREDNPSLKDAGNFWTIYSLSAVEQKIKCRDCWLVQKIKQCEKQLFNNESNFVNQFTQ